MAEDESATAALTILVADPLAKDLACDCVARFAQRRYDALAMVLQRRLNRPVTSLATTELGAYWKDGAPVSLVIGKYSDVIYQAAQLKRKVTPIAALTDQQGAATFRGLFVVRSGNAARSLQDLNDYRLILGPSSCDEKRAAAWRRCFRQVSRSRTGRRPKLLAVAPRRRIN